MNHNHTGEAMREAESGAAVSEAEQGSRTGAPAAGSANAMALEAAPVAEGVRSIAVVGMAPAAIPEIGNLHDSVEVWSLNVGPLAFIGDRWNRHYEVHDFDWLRRRQGGNVPAYCKWLQQDHGDRPIFMPQMDPRIPNCAQYPMEDVFSRYGRRLPDGRWNIYLQSTVDWMIVHAIYEFAMEAQKLERPVQGRLLLFGVDMGMELEYAHQRPSVEHWLGVAVGMGLEVVIPQTSDILQCAYPYGLETYEPRAKKLQQRRQEVEAQAAQAAEAEAQARDRKMALRGVLDDLNYVTQGRY